MPKGDIDVPIDPVTDAPSDPVMDLPSDSAMEKNPTVVPLPECETSAPLECHEGEKVDQVSVKIETNPESQLLQRKSAARASGRTVDVTKAKPIENGADISPATLDIGELQTVTLGHTNKLDILKDENSLAKGVVLNATQLYPPRDVRWASDNLDIDKAKDHELMQNYLVAGNQDSSQDKKELDDAISEIYKSKMSLARKILFGVSFLPSVLFVLCFAVILPCEPPKSPTLCDKQLWSIKLNNTDLSADFGLTETALLVGALENEDNIYCLSSDTGKELWKSNLSSVVQIECDNYDVDGDGTSDCLVMAEGGYLYAYNVSNGHIFWEYHLPTRNPSKFAILSGCEGNDTVAVAISSSEIQVISEGAPRTPLILAGCRTTPKTLTAWQHDGSTDLVFVCEADVGNWTLRFLKQESWCAKEKKLKAITIELLNSFRDKVELNDALIAPSSDGLVVWTEDFVAFFGNDSREQWQISVANHSQNRYLYYGNFMETEKHVVLISGDSTFHSLVTVLSASSGNETFSKSFLTADITNAVRIHDKNQDYILIWLKEMIEIKKNETSIGLSLSTIRPIETETSRIFNLPYSAELRHRLVLLEFQIQNGIFALQEKNISSISFNSPDLLSSEEEGTRLSAAVKDKKLLIFLGRTLTGSAGNVSSMVQAVQVDSWNESPGASNCK